MDMICEEEVTITCESEVESIDHEKCVTFYNMVTIDASTVNLTAQKSAVKKHFIVACDVSDSMNNRVERGQSLTLLDTAKASLLYLVESLESVGRDTIFSLITYNDQAHIVIDREVIGEDEGALDIANKQIESLQATNSTNFLAAFEKIKSVCGDPKSEQTIVVFLTDGKPRMPSLYGVSSSHILEGELLDRLRTDLMPGVNCPIFTIGYGHDHNSTFLSKMTKITNCGGYYFVKNHNHLAEVMGAIVGSAKCIVLTNVWLDLKLMAQFRGREIFTNNVEVIEPEKQVRIPLGIMYGGMQRHLLFQTISSDRAIGFQDPSARYEINVFANEWGDNPRSIACPRIGRHVAKVGWGPYDCVRGERSMEMDRQCMRIMVMNALERMGENLDSVELKRLQSELRSSISKDSESTRALIRDLDALISKSSTVDSRFLGSAIESAIRTQTSVSGESGGASGYSTNNPYDVSVDDEKRNARERVRHYSEGSVRNQGHKVARLEQDDPRSYSEGKRGTSFGFKGRMERGSASISSKMQGRKGTSSLYAHPPPHVRSQPSSEPSSRRQKSSQMCCGYYTDRRGLEIHSVDCYTSDNGYSIKERPRNVVHKATKSKYGRY